MMRMRQKPLDQVDPRRAWEPWQPDSIRPFDVRWAGHLFRRAAFGGTPEELRRAVKDGLDVTIDRLLRGDPSTKVFDQLIAACGASIAQGVDENDLRGWWLYVMLHSGYPLREKLTLFWHNHFATSLAKVRSAPAMFAQNQVMRWHALGSFRALLADISRDPAMLIWLDSNRNVRGKPNENYARELLELFTLGVGRYTEADVREAARAFTGWHTDGEKFHFASKFHDDGPKTFLGQTGPWDGGDIQRIVLGQPAAAVFLCRKLYRYFVSESADPPDALLEPLAEQLRTSDFDVGRVVATILRSQHFYSEHAFRQRIKSPVEHALGIVRIVRPQPSPRELIQPLERMGQALFAPPNVKGWPGGKAWLNSATMLARQNFAQAMIGDAVAPAAAPVAVPDAPEQPIATAPVDLPAPPAAPSQPAPFVAWIKEQNPASPAALVDLVVDALLQGDVMPAERQRLIDFVAAGNPQEAQRDQRIGELAHAVMSLPEFALA